MIYEEDLLVGKEGNLCILLRFKNCTGNIINLEDERQEVSETELALATLVLSIDPKFKNQRTRTITQAIEMVLRQRTISSGYYDF